MNNTNHESQITKPAILLVIALGALAGGCIGQEVLQRDYYEPTASTFTKRDDGLKTGALKSERVKTGVPDWSAKSLSIISVGK